MRRGALVSFLPATLCVALPTQAQSPIDFGFILAEQSRPSFRIVGAGARAAGMGGAFTALADDASAASFNPAGLALLIEPEVSLVVDGRRHREDYDRFVKFDPAAETFNGYYSDSGDTFDTAGINFAALTLPFDVRGRNLCLQLSYHRLIDFETELTRTVVESDLEGNPLAVYDQRIDQSGDIHTLSLGAAYQLTPRMSLGANLSRWSGSWSFSSFDDGRAVTGSSRAYFTYDQRNSLRGWNWNLGVLLRYPHVNVGYVYRGAFDADLSFAERLTSNLTDELTVPSVTIPLHWPSSWTAGLAFKPLDVWYVTVDYARYNWSEMTLEKVGEGGVGLNFFDFAPTSETTTEDVGQWRFGTELTLFSGATQWHLRAGYFREEQPQHFLALRDEDIVEKGFTAGLGVKVGRLAVDLAYQWRETSNLAAQFIDPRNLISPVSVGLGRRETTEHRIVLAAVLQFSREATRHVLDYLFVGER